MIRLHPRLGRPLGSKLLYSMHQHRCGFAIDIDGTLLVSHKPLPRAREALNRLLHSKVPFLLLTNNIARSEEAKAQEINQLLKLDRPLTGRDVVLNFTPMKPRFDNFAERTVLVIGREKRLADILPLQEIPKYVTIAEYCEIFPESTPLSSRTHFPHSDSKTAASVKKRLGLESLDKHTLCFSAILILTTPTNWEECYQIVVDLLSTETGAVSTSNRYEYVANHIPVVAAFNDQFHVGHSHNLPRLLLNPFHEGLKAVYRSVYRQELEIEYYGKPQPIVYEFAKKALEKTYGTIDKMVMIGDNVEADIVGPHKMGWDTILVKSGVAKEDSEFATINAEDIF